MINNRLRSDSIWVYVEGDRIIEYVLFLKFSEDQGNPTYFYVFKKVVMEVQGTTCWICLYSRRSTYEGQDYILDDIAKYRTVEWSHKPIKHHVTLIARPNAGAKALSNQSANLIQARWFSSYRSNGLTNRSLDVFDVQFTVTNPRADGTTVYVPNTDWALLYNNGEEHFFLRTAPPWEEGNERFYAFLKVTVHRNLCTYLCQYSEKADTGAELNTFIIKYFKEGTTLPANKYHIDINLIYSEEHSDDDDERTDTSTPRVYNNPHR
jgi:hypothetical protein